MGPQATSAEGGAVSAVMWPPLWSYFVVLTAFVAIVYLPDLGRGFVKDDFSWVLASRLEGVSDAVRVFTDTTGFFRPLVSLTFSVNERLFGAEPFGYGLTNLLFAIGTAGAVMWLGSTMRLPPGCAVLAGALWLLNLHGINMAILWISGRTALLLSLFAALAAVATRTGHHAAAAVLALCAMLSKEEAMLLPIPLAVIVWNTPNAGWRILARAGTSFVLVLVVYIVLRTNSDAVTPATAPGFYRFVFSWPHILKNITEYADRTGTLMAGIVLLVALGAWRIPTLMPNERATMWIGAWWVASGFAITVFLPVRSSLYACFPSVGSALAAGALVSAFWRHVTVRRRRIYAIGALLLPILATPVYRARNVRWVELADLSSSVAPTLQAAARAATNDNLLMIDDQTTRVSLSTAFGSLLAEATAVLPEDRRTVWMVPPPPGTELHETQAVPPYFKSAWMLKDGQLVEVDAARWIGARAVVMN